MRFLKNLLNHVVVWTLAIKHLSPENIGERRLQAVRLRLDGFTVAESSRRTGLSAPTVSAAWKAFKEGGWEAVPLKPRGRRKGQAEVLGAAQQAALWRQLGEQPPAPLPAWNSKALAEWLSAQPAPVGTAVSPRAIEHWWQAHGLVVEPLQLQHLAKRRSIAGRWYRQQVLPTLEAVQDSGGTVWQGGVRALPAGQNDARRYQFYLHGKRGALHIRGFTLPPRAGDYIALFERLLPTDPACRVGLIFHGAWFQASAEVQEWLAKHPTLHLITVPPNAG